MAAAINMERHTINAQVMELSEEEFTRKADETLARIEHAVEAAALDGVDYENVAEILTLEFADGSKVIVNKQGAARQLWVAARSGGFHYNFDSARKGWINDQGGGELFAELSRIVSQQSGVAVTLRG